MKLLLIMRKKSKFTGIPYQYDLILSLDERPKKAVKENQGLVGLSYRLDRLQKDLQEMNWIYQSY